MAGGWVVSRRLAEPVAAALAAVMDGSWQLDCPTE